MVESYKSGFEPPGEVEFEDYGQAMKRTASETSLSNTREAKERPTGKSKGKLWPFIKNKNKVTHEFTLNKESHSHLNAQQSLTGLSASYFPQLGSPYTLGLGGGKGDITDCFTHTLVIEIYSNVCNVMFVVSLLVQLLSCVFILILFLCRLFDFF